MVYAFKFSFPYLILKFIVRTLGMSHDFRITLVHFKQSFSRKTKLRDGMDMKRQKNKPERRGAANKQEY